LGNDRTSVTEQPSQAAPCTPATAAVLRMRMAAYLAAEIR
jgi:hypothetical protein